MTGKPTKTTYADAGVSIDAGNEFVQRIKPFAKSTKRLGADSELGGFGALFDLAKLGYQDPILVSSTDGVGTKLKIAFAVGKHDTVGIDLVAMCVNDLVVQGAEPLFFLDYFATSKLELDCASDVVKGIAEGCRQANCALTGGETAEMPGMYQPGHYDLAGFSVGIVERNKILPTTTLKAGDVLLGLASSGFHSNGFSLVRHVLDKNTLDYASASPFNTKQSIGELLLTPTKIYVKSCLSAIHGGSVKALAHITGGGLLENIPRVLPENLKASISKNSWEMPEVFKWIQKLGNIETQEMLRTFNCGIGMVIVTEASEAEKTAALLRQAGETVYTIGTLAPRDHELVTVA